VRTTTSSTWASVMVRGTPGRGSSLSPSGRLRKNRARHLLTVPRLTPSRAATARLAPPSAQASTIRAQPLALRVGHTWLATSATALITRLAQVSARCTILTLWEWTQRASAKVA
jgi:hypothetical protein